MEMSGFTLDVSNLTVEYVTSEGTVHAVNDIDLKILPRQSVGLVGETGAGKTSTALAIMNLIPSPPGIITSGKIILNGYDVLNMKDSELDQVRGSEVAMIFQDPMTALNPVLNIGEQIEESILLHENISKAEAHEKACAMLEMVGIDRSRVYDYPHQLSGGMKQRVIIAIALCCNPHLLIADEPTTALDVTIQAQVLDLISQLRDQYKTAMLLITHDLGVVAEMCDEVCVMYAGRIVEHGTVKDVFTATKHPYTEGLFDSLPKIHDKTSLLKPIIGIMPDPTVLPAGCTFAPRCRYAMEICFTRRPSLDACSDTHKVACLAYEVPGFSLERNRHG